MTRSFVVGLVSVIIPVYNAAKFLDRTISSVLSQTYKNIEMVLVDDCSKDNSAEIIKKYQQNHLGIIYKLQEKNMGAAVARNTALCIARGQYVAFLDSDDEWLPDKLTKQIDLLKAKKGAFAYTAIDMINANDNVVKSKRPVKEQVDYNFLLRNTMIATSSVLIDRNIIGDFQMPLIRGGQDYATWLQILRLGIIAYGIDEVYTHYRVGHPSLSSGKLKSLKQIWHIQTYFEGIAKCDVIINLGHFIVNSIKKYFF